VLGFGTGAVTELPGVYLQNHANIDDWNDALWVDRLPISSGCRLSPAQVDHRRVLSRLLCNMALENGASQVFPGEPGPLAEFKDRGFVAEDDRGRLAVTEQGRFALHQHWGDASPVYRWASGF
jgi:oxygen-independent coproporphyrinogen-3 oxidase